jgi:hypothetical protein
MFKRSDWWLVVLAVTVAVLLALLVQVLWGWP